LGELGAFRLIGDSFDLCRLLIVPADDDGDAWIAAKVLGLARVFRGVEIDLESRRGGDADDRGLGRMICTVAGDHAEAVARNEGADLFPAQRTHTSTCFETSSCSSSAGSSMMRRFFQSPRLNQRKLTIAVTTFATGNAHQRPCEPIWARCES